MCRPRLYGIVVLFCTLFGIPARGGTPIPIAEVKHAGPVSFEQDILPIFRKNCLACHDAKEAAGDLVLETAASVIKGGDSGPAVTPGRSEGSLLLKLGSHQDEPAMPPADNDVAASALTPGELGLIRLWIDEGAEGGAQERSVSPTRWRALPAGRHPIYAVAVPPDGQLAVCARANQIFVYHALTGQLITRLADPDLSTSGKPPSGIAHWDPVQALAFNEKGDLLASGGFRTVKLWRVPWEARAAGGPPVRVIGDVADPNLLVDRVVALDFSHSGKLLATGGGVPSRSGEIKIWNVADGSLVRTIPDPHTDSVNAVAFSPDDSFLASAGSDKYVRKFSVATGEQVLQFEGHTDHALAVSWRADGRMLASAGADGKIRIWNADTGERLREITGYTKPVTAVRFIGKTQFFACSSGDPLVRIHNADNGGVQRNFTGIADYVYAIAVSPDMNAGILAAGGHDGTLWIWTTGNGRLLKAIEPPQSQ